MNHDKTIQLRHSVMERFGVPTGWIMTLLFAAVGGCVPSTPAPMDKTTLHVLENARTIYGGFTPAIITGNDVQVYLNAVGSRLGNAAIESSGGRDAMQSAIEVDLLSDDVPLAFTYGGEHVYISTGAMRLCGSEEDLAAMLAHEYAHLLERHQQKHDQLDSPELIAVADLLVHSPLTAGEEMEADQEGFLLFERGGWDPARYADAWERLGGAQGEGRAATIRRWAANSPSASDEWRRPPVADRFTFHRILRTAGAIPKRSDDMSRLLMRCVKSCVGTDNTGDRNSAIASLESLIPAPASGGGRTEIGPRPVPGP